MTMPLETRIAILEAKSDIQDLFTAFAKGADAYCEPALLEPIFTDDAIFDVGSFGRMEGGGQAIAETMKMNNVRGFHWTLHYMVSPEVKVAPTLEHADAFCYFWGVAKSHPDNGERSFWVGGTYTAEAVRTSRGWRFRRLNLHVELLSPYEEGFNGKVRTFGEV
jgi:SnoaL-like domain